jgi:hypothetical protein
MVVLNVVVALQHRHPGYFYADLRIRRRLQIRVRLTTPNQPELAGGSSIVTEI